MAAELGMLPDELIAGRASIGQLCLAAAEELQATLSASPELELPPSPLCLK